MPLWSSQHHLSRGHPPSHLPSHPHPSILHFLHNTPNYFYLTVVELMTHYCLKTFTSSPSFSGQWPLFEIWLVKLKNLAPAHSSHFTLNFVPLCPLFSTFPAFFQFLTTTVMPTSSPTCMLSSLPGICLSVLFTCLTQLSIHLKSLFIYFSDFFFFFLPNHLSCGILVPLLGIEPMAPAVEV